MRSPTAWIPDPERSRAVLIGVAEAPELPGLPAVRANLADLHAQLTARDVGVLPTAHCVIADDGAAEAQRVVAEAADAAEDLLLVYLAGHAVVTDDGVPHLVCADGTVPLARLLDGMAASRAPARVLVLDVRCDREVRPDLSGVYAVTACAASLDAYAPAGDPHTAFTGALLDALHRDPPLILDVLVEAVGGTLSARGLPGPRRQPVDLVGGLTLVRPPRNRPRRTVRRRAPRLDPLVVGSGRTLAARFGLRALQVGIGAGAGLHVFLVTGTHWVVGLLVATPFALYATVREWQAAPRVELVVDRFGLAAQVDWKRVRVTWQDVHHVGVLDLPELGRPLARSDTVVARLRPGVDPVPVLHPDDLPELLHRLGYVSFGQLATLATTAEQVVPALRSFAGRRLLLDRREFLAADPRLPPDVL